jgi:hypothetical protein
VLFLILKRTKLRAAAVFCSANARFRAPRRTRLFTCWRAIPRKRLAARMGDTRTNCHARVRTDLAPHRHARFTNARSHINVDTVLRRSRAECGEWPASEHVSAASIWRRVLRQCDIDGLVLSEDLSTLRSSVRSYYDLRRAYAAEFNHPLGGLAPCC